MRFNISDYPGNVVMHCSTHESAKTFTQYLHSLGHEWCNGESYLTNDYFDESGYQDTICYNFNNDTQCDIGYYLNEGYTILEFSDFEWGSEEQPKRKRRRKSTEKDSITIDELLKDFIAT